MTRIATAALGALTASLLVMAGCATAPEVRSEQQELISESDAALQAMVQEDPTLGPVLQQAAGYAVFPDVGSGAVVVGATVGVGVLYEQGRPVGYVELREGSIGPQIGGHAYSQLIVFQWPNALERVKAGNFDLTADVSATFLANGAAASAPFEDGTAVFIDSESGLMAKASVGGQSINFKPAD